MADPADPGRMFDQAEAAPSYWHAITPREALPSPSTLPARARIVIVGLGIAGAATALALVEAGVDPDDIIILDGSRMAFAASGRNAGFVLSFPGPEVHDWERWYGFDDAVSLLALNGRNAAWVREFVTRIGLWHQPGGSWFCAGDEDESSEVEDCLRFLRAAGSRGTQLMTRPLCPRVDLHSSIFQPGDIGINPVLYVAALVRAAGVRFVEGARLPADGLRADETGGVTLTSTAGTIKARHVVLATNIHTRLFFREAASGPLALVPGRNQVAAVEIRGETTNRLWGDAIWYARRGYDYWRQLPDGTLIVGGGRDQDPVGEETFDLGRTPTIERHIERTLLPLLAAGRSCRVLRRWQGILDFSRDGLPFVAPWPGLEDRVHFLGGFSGYGLGMHRVAAEAAAGMVLGTGDGGLLAVSRLGRLPAAGDRPGNA